MAIDYEGLKVTGLTGEQTLRFVLSVYYLLIITGMIWVPLLAMWIEDQN